MPLTSPKLEKLELNTLQTHLPRYTTSGMSSREVQWWTAYISMLQDSSSTGHNDQWVLQTLERLQTFAHCHSQTPSLPPILEDLSQIVSSERQDIPAMYIGNQRRQQAQQRPAQPARTQQRPAQPATTQQRPAQPVRTRQQPAQPARTQQRPAQPARTRQQPTQPARIRQQPAQPARTRQRPAQPARTQLSTAQLRENEVCTDTTVTSCIHTFL